MDPGQDKKPGVVDNEVEVLLALLGAPTDKVISGGCFPDRCPKTQKGYDLLLEIDNVSDLIPWYWPVSKIVIALDIFVPQVGLIFAYNRMDAKLLKA